MNRRLKFGNIQYVDGQRKFYSALGYKIKRSEDHIMYGPHKIESHVTLYMIYFDDKGRKCRFIEFNLG